MSNNRPMFKFSNQTLWVRCPNCDGCGKEYLGLDGYACSECIATNGPIGYFDIDEMGVVQLKRFIALSAIDNGYIADDDWNLICQKVYHAVRDD